VTVDGIRTRLADVGPLAPASFGPETPGTPFDPRARLDSGAGLEVSAHVERAELPPEGGETELVVRARGSDLSEGRVARAPLEVHLVLDRSSSMHTSWPHVVHAARHVVGELAADDVLHIVAYGTDAAEVLAPSEVGSGASARRALGTVSVGGGTNIEAGLRFAYDAIERRSAARRRLVFLVSDGVPNNGEVDRTQLAELAAEARAELGVTTTTIGLGDQYDAPLLQELARHGGGGYHVARTAPEVKPTLAQELSVAANVSTRDVDLRVDLADHVDLVGVVDGNVGAERVENGVRFAAPALGPGEERRMVLKVRVRPGAKRVKAARQVARVRVCHTPWGRRAPLRFEAKLSVAIGTEARPFRGTLATRVLADADLGQRLPVVAEHVNNGRGAQAAAELEAHARAYSAPAGRRSASSVPDVRIRHRAQAVMRVARAVRGLTAEAHHAERRRVALAIGELGLRLRGR
jgi:Mg-chelatase subunit ChlD